MCMIRQLITDENFIGTILELEKNAWLSFRELLKNFRGNKREKNYSENVLKLLEKWKTLGFNMSIKLDFLHRYLPNFLENLCNFNDIKGEQFNRDFIVMPELYPSRWDVNLMVHYCSRKSESVFGLNTRKSYQRHFFSPTCTQFD